MHSSMLCHTGAEFLLSLHRDFHKVGRVQRATDGALRAGVIDTVSLTMLFKEGLPDKEEVYSQ